MESTIRSRNSDVGIREGGIGVTRLASALSFLGCISIRLAGAMEKPRPSCGVTGERGEADTASSGVQWNKPERLLSLRVLLITLSVSDLQSVFLKLEMSKGLNEGRCRLRLTATIKSNGKPIPLAIIPNADTKIPLSWQAR